MSAIGMPPHILGLFQSRPPLEFQASLDKKKMPEYDGLNKYLEHFESTAAPPKPHFETPKEYKLRMKREKLDKHERRLRELIKHYNPHVYVKPDFQLHEEEEERENGVDEDGRTRSDKRKKHKRGKGLTSDAFKTLFVARISYECTEKKLKREFEQYGPIRCIRMPHDKHGKPRGYAFIEFESDRDMKEAYKQADGRKIEGRRVLVDVERARTVAGWLPRRLGGGRGPLRGSTGKPKRPQAPLNTNQMGYIKENPNPAATYYKPITLPHVPPLMSSGPSPMASGLPPIGAAGPAAGLGPAAAAAAMNKHVDPLNRGRPREPYPDAGRYGRFERSRSRDRGGGGGEYSDRKRVYR